MAPKVTFYDLPSQQGTAWSLNPWKTRLALHYKGIEYKTEWIEYPDVAPFAKENGIPANSEGTEYTIPILKTESGQLIMDSDKIAEHLETTYSAPEYPSFRLDDPARQNVFNTLKNVFTPLRRELLPAVPAILNPISQKYFNETRTVQFGMTLPELAEKEGGEKAWDAAKPHLDELAGLIKGPYVLGDITSYADFHIVTFLQFAKRLGGGRYERLVRENPKFGTIYEAYGPYMRKED